MVESSRRTRYFWSPRAAVRAPNGDAPPPLDGLKKGWVFRVHFHSEPASARKIYRGSFHSTFTVMCKPRDVFTYYPTLVAAETRKLSPISVRFFALHMPGMSH